MDTADHAMATRTFWTALTFTNLPLTLLDVLIFAGRSDIWQWFFLTITIFFIMSVVLQLFEIVFAVDWVEKRDKWKP
jgi:hypothetical protein